MSNSLKNRCIMIVLLDYATVKLTVESVSSTIPTNVSIVVSNMISVWLLIVEDETITELTNVEVVTVPVVTSVKVKLSSEVLKPVRIISAVDVTAPLELSIA